MELLISHTATEPVEVPSIEKESSTQIFASELGKLRSSRLPHDHPDVSLLQLMRRCTYDEVEKQYAEHRITHRITEYLDAVAHRVSSSASASIEPRKLLLLSPPGRGKTEAIMIAAEQLHIPLFLVSLHRLKDYRESGANARLDAYFQIAMESRPCIFFLDEADALFDSAQCDKDTTAIVTRFIEWVGNPRVSRAGMSCGCVVARCGVMEWSRFAPM